MRQLSESSRDEPQIRNIFGTEVIEDVVEDLVWESEFVVAVLDGEWIVRWECMGSMSGMKGIRCWVMVVQGRGFIIEVERMHPGF